MLAMATSQALWLPTAQADDGPASMVQQPGRLRVAVYKDFPPYSFQDKGVDVDIARAIAKKLGLDIELAWFPGDDDMNDDLRNMVWKGHYMGTRPADVMMHVPVDDHLAKANDKVRIFAPYALETIAIVRDPRKVPAVNGSAAVALEVFTREKVGVETGSLADAFLLSVLNGRIREQVVHFRSVADAAAAMRRGEIAAVMAPRGELEAALATTGGKSDYALDTVRMPELRVQNWAMGLAIKADNDALEKSLSNAVAELQKEGVIDQIFARYHLTHQTAQ
jgi:ABC-type amino acid transport substrate-binding protein